MEKIEKLPLRIVRLVSAEKTLSEEGIITDTVRARIRNKINQLLSEDPALLTRILLQSIDLNNETDSVESEEVHPVSKLDQKNEIPSKIGLRLNETQKKILIKLLANQDELVSMMDLITSVYGENIDNSVDLSKDNKYARSIAASISSMRKLITDYANIKNSPGKGYLITLAKS